MPESRGLHIDRAIIELVIFGLGQFDLDGGREALRDRDRMATETFRLRHQRVEALARRAQVFEYAIADATRPEEVLAIVGCSGNEPRGYGVSAW